MNCLFEVFKVRGALLLQCTSCYAFPGSAKSKLWTINSQNTLLLENQTKFADSISLEKICLHKRSLSLPTFPTCFPSKVGEVTKPVAVTIQQHISLPPPHLSGTLFSPPRCNLVILSLPYCRGALKKPSRTNYPHSSSLSNIKFTWRPSIHLVVKFSPLEIFSTWYLYMSHLHNENWSALKRFVGTRLINF